MSVRLNPMVQDNQTKTRTFVYNTIVILPGGVKYAQKNLYSLEIYMHTNIQHVQMLIKQRKGCKCIIFAKTHLKRLSMRGSLNANCNEWPSMICQYKRINTQSESDEKHNRMQGKMCLCECAFVYMCA